MRHISEVHNTILSMSTVPGTDCVQKIIMDYVTYENESWEWVMGHVSGRAWYESCHSFSCVTWCMCHVTHSDVLRDPCVIRLILVCYTIDVFSCVTSFMCYIIYVSYHSFSCVIWSMCSDAWHDVCVIWLIVMCHTIHVFWCVIRCMCQITHSHAWYDVLFIHTTTPSRACRLCRAPTASHKCTYINMENSQRAPSTLYYWK